MTREKLQYFCESLRLDHRPDAADALLAHDQSQREEIARLQEALMAFTKCIDAHQQREQSGLLRDDMWEAYEQAQAALAENRSKW